MGREKWISKLDKLDSELENLFDDLKRFNRDQLFRKPDPEVWSPMQVMYHLYKSELLSINYIKKKVHYNKDLATGGPLSFFRSVALGLALHSPMKYRAALAVDVDDWPEDLALEAFEKDWLNLRDELRSFLMQIDISFLRKNVYRHPLAGRLTLHQMLKFFNDHFRRHRKQIYRRLNADMKYTL